MMNKRSIFYTLSMALTPEEVAGMTKYPSFYEPFARINEEGPYRGKTIGRLEYYDMADEVFEVTEKLDGTGSRCIIIPHEEQFIIGSRNQLLAYNKDTLHFEQQHIVELSFLEMKHLTERLKEAQLDVLENGLVAIFFETIGRTILKRGKQYFPRDDKNDTGFKGQFNVFDIRVFHHSDIMNYLGIPRDEWHFRRCRSRGWMTPSEKRDFCEKNGLPYVPYLTTVKGSEIDTPEKACRWLQQFKTSTISGANCEGVVLKPIERCDDYRNESANIKTRVIFKLKFKDFPKEWQ